MNIQNIDIYAPVPVVDGRMQKTGMIAVDPNSIILVGEEPKAVER